MVELASELQTPAPRLVRPPRSKNHKIKKSLVDKPKLIDGTSEALRAPAHHIACYWQKDFQRWACANETVSWPSIENVFAKGPHYGGPSAGSRPCPTLHPTGRNFKILHGVAVRGFPGG